ncbi:MAG: polysaccharide deacetylase [Firmicutes bacterium HGW-Firmicutes-15]|nr:MAG: polysaccharide deacetylase [Firmicutes bacterium HGW-Firmicutes-15]
MILLLKKRTLGFMGTGLFLLCLSFGTFGTFNVALHPNMNKWKQEKLVITMVKTSQKAVALTFDDGPDPEKTPVFLDSLEKYNAHATFFVIGNRAEKQPQILQDMAKRGHEIANHSYSHSYSRFSSNQTAIFKEEIDTAAALIEKITSQKPVLFRPPGGYLSDNLVNLIKDEQLTVAYWTWQQDSKDWKVGTSGTTIANHIINNIKPGQIILLHDGASNGLETAKAVDILLDKLTKEGYQFVTMSELIKLENKE